MCHHNLIHMEIVRGPIGIYESCLEGIWQSYNVWQPYCPSHRVHIILIPRGNCFHKSFTKECFVFHITRANYNMQVYSRVGSFLFLAHR